jgi:hypothetical protein
VPAGVAAGKAAVEFGLDEWDHVDAVDAQEAVAVGEPRCVDVGPLELDSAHHDVGQVSPDEPGATQVRVDELRSLQVVGPSESCHDFSLSSALLPLAQASRRGEQRRNCPKRSAQLSRQQTTDLGLSPSFGRRQDFEWWLRSGVA